MSNLTDDIELLMLEAARMFEELPQWLKDDLEQEFKELEAL